MCCIWPFVRRNKCTVASLRKGGRKAGRGRGRRGLGRLRLEGLKRSGHPIDMVDILVTGHRVDKVDKWTNCPLICECVAPGFLQAKQIHGSKTGRRGWAEVEKEISGPQADTMYGLAAVYANASQLDFFRRNKCTVLGARQGRRETDRRGGLKPSGHRVDKVDNLSCPVDKMSTAKWTRTLDIFGGIGETYPPKCPVDTRQILCNFIS